MSLLSTFLCFFLFSLPSFLPSFLPSYLLLFPFFISLQFELWLCPSRVRYSKARLMISQITIHFFFHIPLCFLFYSILFFLFDHKAITFSILFSFVFYSFIFFHYSISFFYFPIYGFFIFFLSIFVKCFRLMKPRDNNNNNNSPTNSNLYFLSVDYFLI